MKTTSSVKKKLANNFNRQLKNSKICISCLKSKPIADYIPNRNQCKECRTTINKEWVSRNRRNIEKQNTKRRIKNKIYKLKLLLGINNE